MIVGLYSCVFVSLFIINVYYYNNRILHKFPDFTPTIFHVNSGTIHFYTPFVKSNVFNTSGRFYLRC